MRISDWSSDVCSSDLRGDHAGRVAADLDDRDHRHGRVAATAAALRSGLLLAGRDALLALDAALERGPRHVGHATRSETLPPAGVGGEVTVRDTGRAQGEERE